MDLVLGQGALVNPAAGQAVHVVVPSLPWYAFSTPLSAPGWAMGRTARAWAELMRRLGYQRYGVHGGDIGAGVSGMVAGLDGGHVIGMHVVTDPLTAAAAGFASLGMWHDAPWQVYAATSVLGVGFLRHSAQQPPLTRISAAWAGNSVVARETRT